MIAGRRVLHALAPVDVALNQIVLSYNMVQGSKS